MNNETKELIKAIVIAGISSVFLVSFIYLLMFITTYFESKPKGYWIKYHYDANSELIKVEYSKRTDIKNRNILNLKLTIPGFSL